MRLVRGKFGMIVIEDLDKKEVQEEIRDRIIDTYRDDDTFSEEKVEETLTGIVNGDYEIYLDGDIIHMEVVHGFGCLDWYFISMEA